MEDLIRTLIFIICLLFVYLSVEGDEYINKETYKKDH